MSCCRGVLFPDGDGLIAGNIRKSPVIGSVRAGQCFNVSFIAFYQPCEHSSAVVKIAVREVCLTCGALRGRKRLVCGPLGVRITPSETKFGVEHSLTYLVSTAEYDRAKADKTDQGAELGFGETVEGTGGEFYFDLALQGGEVGVVCEILDILMVFFARRFIGCIAGIKYRRGLDVIAKKYSS